MDKISGILPSNRRLDSANLSDAPSIRPSAPDYKKPGSMFGPAANWKVKELTNTFVAEDVTESFFPKKDESMEIGVPAEPSVIYEPIFAPKRQLPMNGPLMAYEQEIYGPEPVQQEVAGVSAVGGGQQQEQTASNDPYSAESYSAEPQSYGLGESIDVYA